MKISILWASLASYSTAFFREIATNNGCQIQLVYQPNKSDSPYGQFDLSFCLEAFEDNVQTRVTLEERVKKFHPDVILMSSWAYPHFMTLSKKLKKKGVYIVSTMDNQYYGTLKQRIGIAASSLFLKPRIDSFLLPGDRQAYFAKKLGYDDVIYGLYAAEVDRFASKVPFSQRPLSFLFAGRLIDKKNITNLLDGYKAYRESCAAPWDLTITGTGPLEKVCTRIPGIQMLGFIQPSDLPAVFQNASCFVLPSIFEPWGVVIHEAAAAGLPIISSFACGAATRFVFEGVNGYIISPDFWSIQKAMLRITHKTDAELEEMSRQSVALANLWTPAKLAGYFIDSIRWRVGSRQYRH
jgi:glycosyltransferase involved in cell wall biosynthesis